MTNPTTYFGWQMPTATDLVTDLPADFEVFGQAVDTDFQDLLGGTTGQILSKTSGTDLDFTWINNDQGDITAVTAGTGITGGGTSGAVTITNDMATTITASGDIVVGTGNGTYDNLPIGTTGQLLTADTTVSPYKVKWATPASGGKVLQVVQGTTTTGVTTTSTSYVDTGVTATITPSSASSKVLVFISQQLLLQGTGAGGAFSGVGLKALRGATTIIDASSSNAGAHSIEAGFSGNSRVGLRGYEALNFLDTPATTSATTYKVQMAVATSGDTLISQGNACQSSIILMEIGA